MAKTRYTAEVRYSAQMGALVGEVRRAGRAQEQAIHGVTEAINRQTTGWRGLGNDLVRVRAAYLTVAGAIGAVGRGALRLVELAGQEATSIRMLDRAFRLHGTTLGEHGAEVDALIERYTSLTQFGDDAVRETLTAIARLTAGTNRSYDELVSFSRLALDIAAETGRTGADAAQIIGQALAGNIRSLRELLPELARELRGMSDGADQAGAAMAGLHSVFDGASLAISETGQKIEEARNRIADLKEEAGGFIADTAGWLIGAFRDVGEAAAQFVVDPLREAGDQFLRLWDAARAARDQGLDLAANVPPSGRSQWGNDLTTGGSVEGPELPAGWTLTGVDRNAGQRPRSARARTGFDLFGGLDRAGGAIGGLFTGARDVLGEKVADTQLAALNSFLDAKQEAFDREREIEQAQLAFLSETSEQRKALIYAEIGAQEARSEATMQALGQIAENTGAAMAQIIGGEKGLATWRRAMMAAEVLWQLVVVGDPLAAAKAASGALLYEAALATAGGSGGGGGRGGGAARGGGPGFNPSQAGALIQRPGGRGGDINVSVNYNAPVYDRHSSRRQVVAMTEEGLVRGEILGGGRR